MHTFPLYPCVTRLLSYPLCLKPDTHRQVNFGGDDPILTWHSGCDAGLYFMTGPTLGEEGGVRSAFYLLIFPSGFFLAQVYTEGLFIGLSFGSLAFLLIGVEMVRPPCCIGNLDPSRRRNPAFTHGDGLVDGQILEGRLEARLLRGLAALSPAISYGLWSLTPLANKFHIVEDRYFDRGLLAIGPSIDEWGKALKCFIGCTLP